MRLATRPIAPPARPAAVAAARAAAVAIIVIAADQLTKAAVRSSIEPGEERKLLPGVQLVDARNRGVAFGFLPGQHLVASVIVAVVLVALLAYFAAHLTRPWLWLPTGMLLGGALGNVIDRVRLGWVTDFIQLPLGWPPFNVADTAITIGVLVLVVVVDRTRGERVAR